MTSISVFVVALSAALGQLEEGSTREHLKDLQYFIGKWSLENTENGEVSTGTMEVEWMHDKNFQLVKGVSKDTTGKEQTSTEIVGWNPISKQIQSWGFGSFGGYGEGRWQKEGTTWTMTYDKPWVRWNGDTLTGKVVRKIVDENTFLEEGVFKVGEKDIKFTTKAKRSR